MISSPIIRFPLQSPTWSLPIGVTQPSPDLLLPGSTDFCPCLNPMFLLQPSMQWAPGEGQRAKGMKGPSLSYAAVS